MTVIEMVVGSIPIQVLVEIKAALSSKFYKWNIKKIDQVRVCFK